MSMTVVNAWVTEDAGLWNGGYLIKHGHLIPPSRMYVFDPLDGAVAAHAHRGPYQMNELAAPMLSQLLS